ncbi:hypothetical protein RRG08_004595 [Elysia crispata]|uniref:Uncharacterized protein n=1 Tax=Elysia crispata TaxID=231223 RepID=A0AAE1E0X7_9GAST|nr:hypothetical protein RRG08_004595 [Elysia crispata]
MSTKHIVTISAKLRRKEKKNRKEKGKHCEAKPMRSRSKGCACGHQQTSRPRDPLASQSQVIRSRLRPSGHKARKGRGHTRFSRIGALRNFMALAGDKK